MFQQQSLDSQDVCKAVKIKINDGNLNLEGVEGVELEPFATLPLAASYFL